MKDAENVKLQERYVKETEQMSSILQNLEKDKEEYTEKLRWVYHKLNNKSR